MVKPRRKLALHRFRRVLLRKLHRQRDERPAPQRIFRPGNDALPLEQVHLPIFILLGTREETRRVVLAPVFTLLGETRGGNRGHRWSFGRSVVCSRALF